MCTPVFCSPHTRGLHQRFLWILTDERYLLLPAHARIASLEVKAVMHDGVLLLPAHARIASAEVHKRVLLI